MADRNDPGERLAILERMAEDNRTEIRTLRDRQHKTDNLLTAHSMDIEYMRPVVISLDRLSNKAVGIGIGIGLSSGAVGAWLFRVIGGH